MLMQAFADIVSMKTSSDAALLLSNDVAEDLLA